MNSTGQAFVKEFARQSSPAKPAASPVPQPTKTPSNAVPSNAVPSSPTPVTGPSMPQPPVPASPATPPSASVHVQLVDFGGVEIASSVVDSTQLWIDDSYDSSLPRLDDADQGIPSPHLNRADSKSSQSQTVQHDRNQSQQQVPLSVERPMQRADASHATVETPVLGENSPAPIVKASGVNSPSEAAEAVSMEMWTEETISVHVPESPQPLEQDERSSAPEPAIEPVPLRPSWEVDVFEIPQTVADLFFNDTLFQNLSDRMGEACEGGLRTMLMTSMLPGEGRTTVAVGVALAAAATGKRVALLDADISDPTLVEDLRLDVDHGWLQHIREGMPLNEIAIHAVEDNLTLIPLLPWNATGPAKAVECAMMIETLKSHFDLVIIDGPIVDVRTAKILSSSIDSALIVRDVNQSSVPAINEFAGRLRNAGIAGIGVAQNFEPSSRV